MAGMNYNYSMEKVVKTIRSSEEAELMLKNHQSERHPEIECQCLECLWAREMLAQMKVWKQVR